MAENWHVNKIGSSESGEVRIWVDFELTDKNNDGELLKNIYWYNLLSELIITKSEYIIKIGD